MSKVVDKKPCEQCVSEGGDKDGNNQIVYADGSTYCFAGHGTSISDTNISDSAVDTQHVTSFKPLRGIFRDLPTRKLTKKICEKWKVLYLENYLNEPTLAFTYLKAGELSGYALKSLSKNCSLLGDVLGADMFGSHLHNDPLGKTLVITEGHEDCISASTAAGDIMYHYTTLPNGTDNAGKSVERFIDRHYDKLSRYQFISLCFDSDKPGQIATEKFITHFNQIGKVKRVKLPLKDANEMLKKGQLEPLKWAIIKAELDKPKQIVDWDELIPLVVENKPVNGRPWPWKPMDDITFGFYPGKIYAIGAATSVGKTSFIKDVLFHFTENEPRVSVGCFFLEQKPQEVALKLLSSKVNQDLEQPDTEWWDKERLTNEMQELRKHVFLYDPTKGIVLDDVINAIYYFVNVEKVQMIILDNLTILSENLTIGGRKASEAEYMVEVGKLFNKVKRELNVSIFLICHLSQDKISKQAYVTTSPKNSDAYLGTTSKGMDEMINRPGLTWETGRMPSIESLYGGATLAKLADYVIVLARNTTSQDDLEFRTTRVKFLKTRLRKKRAQIEFELIYDPLMGKLVYEGGN